MRTQDRRGASSILVMFFVITMLFIAALSIGICQIQLGQNQAQIAADCASLSAATMIDSQVSPIAAALDISDTLKVGNCDVSLTNNDVTLGSATINSLTGKIDFVAGGTPQNAVKVAVQMSGASKAGNLPLWLPLLGTKKYSVEKESISAKFEHDICLVIDRSQSMCLHQTQNKKRPYHPSYPKPQKGPKAFFPHPNVSRWAAAVRSVSHLGAALEKTKMKERLCIASFACDRTYKFNGERIFVEAATSDFSLSTDYQAGTDILKNMFEDLPMVNGQTWIHSGIDEGAQLLFGEGARSQAFKTMILLTDGKQFVRGDKGNRDFIGAAEKAAGAGIKIHSIIFGVKDGLSQMEEIAEVGGGKAYYAPDEKTLSEIFASIGSAPPVSLIK